MFFSIINQTRLKMEIRLLVFRTIHQICKFYEISKNIYMFTPSWVNTCGSMCKGVNPRGKDDPETVGVLDNIGEHTHHLCKCT